jgi:hypothetical protein
VVSWQQAVISLQTLLAQNLIVGGKTAPELHGLAHYLQQATTVVVNGTLNLTRVYRLWHIESDPPALSASFP